MSDNLVVAGLEIQPGEKKQGDIEIPNFFADGQTMENPYTVLHGSEPGMTLYIQVAQHGSEVMGLDAIRRLLKELDPNLMKGNLIYCLPNPLAFRERVRATVFDPKPGGMNRIWPGDPGGSLTERMAHKIWTELVIHGDAVIDLHTASDYCPVWVFYEPEGVSECTPEGIGARSEEMAKLFGAPILYAETEDYGGRKTLRAQCVDNGIPAIVPELGGHGKFDEDIIQMTYRGLRNILVELGIIEGRTELPEKQVKLEWKADPKTNVSRANQGGIFIPEVKLGDVVKKGERLGYIYSPRTFETLEQILAPQDGYIFTIRQNPVVHQGDNLVSVPKVMKWLEN
jgi:predicted deacylase